MLTINNASGIKKHVLWVKLDGKKVGSIREVTGGYQYSPIGTKTGGDVFVTLQQCTLTACNNHCNTHQEQIRLKPLAYRMYAQSHLDTVSRGGSS